MGCVPNKSSTESVRNPTEPEKKPYSFAARKAGLKKEDYMFKDRDGEVLTRDPGKIDGQQFLIENCKNCKIFLRDHTAAINIDVCENCELFFGPCLGSIYVRDSKSCKMIAATAQLRMRNCSNFDMLVFSISDPSIEECTELKIGCFDYSYPELKSQFEKAKLNIWNNVWSEVYDFTPGAGPRNYEYLSSDIGVKQLLTVTEGLDENAPTVIPRTIGRSKDIYTAVFLDYYIEINGFIFAAITFYH